MRYYSASAYGQALWTHVLHTNQAFTVHSIFQSGMNLLLGKRLLYICSSRTTMPPFAVVLKEPSMIALLALCRQGDRGLYQREGKRLLWESGVVLDLSEANDPGSRIAENRRGGNWTANSRKHLKYCWDKQKPAYGLASEFPQAEGLISSFKGVISEDSIVTSRRLDFWIGRGPGLTPGGDDMLVGLLAVLFWARYTVPCGVILDYLHTKGQKRTTAVSCEYLYYAAQGIFSNEILELLEAMAELKACESAFNSLLAVGHTSGADTILGMLCGLELVLEERYGYEETFCNCTGRQRNPAARPASRFKNTKGKHQCQRALAGELDSAGT